MGKQEQDEKQEGKGPRSERTGAGDLDENEKLQK